ncbi:hypothetical protein QJS10_CPB11g02085 [Acorus calamus]|uniref:Coiled-coil domain-containing protein n=1 Tax=Acorus calamus TaxID=4465 RepID=A0AAV9DUJ3_ACOCL|nr:hypothetical protein QJS10_CPB11g02085 [Acorus calamus]
MPKKIGTNSKAEAARERKTAIEAEKKEKKAREKEEYFWREAEGAESRAARKKEEEAEKRAEAAARRAENRRLAEAEERKLERSDRGGSGEEEGGGDGSDREAGGGGEEEEEPHRRGRGVRADRLVANTNRNEAVVEAHSVEEALAKMNVSDALPSDRHPERRLKASFKAFEEAELLKLREEKPGLTLTQYRDMIWKLWKKSPDNPLNQLIISFIEFGDHDGQRVFFGAVPVTGEPLLENLLLNSVILYKVYAVL